MNGLVVEHAVTLSVRDSAALLDATAGPDVGDPYYAPPVERPFLEETGADPGRLRVAFTTESPMDSPVHSDCVEAVESTARLLADMGHFVEEAAPEYDDRAFRIAFTTIWFSNLAANIALVGSILGREMTAADFEPLTWALGMRGAAHTGAEYVGAVTEIQSISRQVARFFQRYDVWLTPTLATPPPKLGFLHPEPAEIDIRPFAWRVQEFVPFTQLANATGQPALSLPLHWNDDELPIGVQFVARFGDEATLFRLAARLEEARPWRAHRPSHCA